MFTHARLAIGLVDLKDSNDSYTGPSAESNTAAWLFLKRAA